MKPTDILMQKGANDSPLSDYMFLYLVNQFVSTNNEVWQG